MQNLLYIVAVVLVIGWFIGLLRFQMGGLIHLLLILAVVAVLFRVLQGNSGK